MGRKMTAGTAFVALPRHMDGKDSPQRKIDNASSLTEALAEFDKRTQQRNSRAAKDGGTRGSLRAAPAAPVPTRAVEQIQSTAGISPQVLTGISASDPVAVLEQT